ncbi:MAG: NUDIX hydrolase [Armatimonadetes bacterium]|nr:NUDIX hydrolase [Armatimonadota bacterium]NOG94030.1 NUDIX hydrolase [Armatimonadota bacterium]
MRRFPTGRWQKRQLEFQPAPARPPFKPFAALMFVWDGDKVLLTNIPGRGWCIPSGGVEPEEDPKDAAIRETMEEGGAEVTCVTYLGCYRVIEKGHTRWASAFVSRLASFVDIPSDSEATDRRLATMEELPDIYHHWDALLEAVFRYSSEVIHRQR